jgi:hypothetical protein
MLFPGCVNIVTGGILIMTDRELIETYLQRVAAVKTLKSFGNFEYADVISVEVKRLARELESLGYDLDTL